VALSTIKQTNKQTFIKHAIYLKSHTFVCRTDISLRGHDTVEHAFGCVATRAISACQHQFKVCDFDSRP